MKRFIVASLLALLLQACSKAPELPAPAPVVPATIAWVKPDGANIEPILAQARAGNKPVFLYWGAVWCPPCNQIKATVFNRQDFIERSKLFVPVYLDGDTQGAQKLATRFKVRGYPTMILFRPDGTELTRLPGEVDAAKYMELLNLGLAASSSVKESLALALGNSGAVLTPEAWRQLAYYAWDYDEAGLVAQKERAGILHRLAQACPATQQEAANRLNLKAIVLSSIDKKPLSDGKADLALVAKILGDAKLARENFDVLANYSADMVSILTGAGSPERRTLKVAWNAAMDQFASDASLSRMDRLSAVSAKVALAKMELPQGARAQLDTALLTQVQDAVATADKTSTNTYERQALIPNAADLLGEAGLLDQSDALLKSELPKAISPYYHMLVLAGNARQRGDKAASLDWSEQAWRASVGPATRLQWGSGYVNHLIDLAPQDSARIETAAAAVLAELEPAPETFYERNRRGLEKMGQRLLAWNKNGRQQAVITKLTRQLDAVCAGLPDRDEARAACAGVFKASSKQSL